MYSHTLLFSLIFLTTLTYPAQGIGSVAWTFGVAPSVPSPGYSVDFFVSDFVNNATVALGSGEAIGHKEAPALGVVTSSLDRHTRNLYFVTTTRGNTFPSVVQWDVMEDVIVNEFVLTYRVPLALEFDVVTERLLVLCLNSFTKEHEFIALDVQNGEVEVLIAQVLDFETVHLGISAFDPELRRFYAVMSSSSLDTLGYLISIDVETKVSTASTSELSEVVYALQYIPFSSGEMIVGVVLEDQGVDFVDNRTEYAIQLRRINVVSGAIADVIYDVPDEEVEAVLNSLGEDRYSSSSYSVFQSRTDHIFYKVDIALDQVDDAFLDSKDASYFASISLSDCPNGHYESGDDCLPCGLGGFQNKYEQTECKGCPTGSYTNLTGQAKCALCTPGQFQDDVNSTYCDGCPIAFYQNQQGQSSCIPCPSGFSTDQESSRWCTPCPPGQHQPAQQQTTCVLCNPGTFNPDFGRSECPQCEPGSFSSSPGKLQCDLCSSGLFNAYSGQSECFECPLGGDCTGLGVVIPIALPGFYTSDTRNLTFVQCQPSEACAGDDSCNSGYRGYACSECTTGYYKYNTFCKDCPNNPEFRLFGFFAIAITIVLVLLGVLVRYRRKIAALKKTGFYSSVQIGYNFMQIVSIMSSFQLDWPDVAREIIAVTWVANFNSDNLASDCSFTLSYVQKYILILFLPLIVLAIILSRWFILWAIHKVNSRLEQKWRDIFPTIFDTTGDPDSTVKLKEAASWFLTAKNEKRIHELFTQAVNASCTFLSFVYLFVAAFILSYFDCVNQGDGSFTLEANPETKCFGGEWAEFLAVVIIGFMLYVIGIPVLLFTVLFKSRNHLDRTSVYDKYGMLYIRYKLNMFFWELVILGRKISFVLMNLFFNQNPVAQVVLSIIIMLGFLGGHGLARPYLLPRHNIMDAVLMGVNILFLIVGVIHYAAKPADDVTNTLIGILLCGAGLYIVVNFCLDLQTHWKTVRKSHDNVEMEGSDEEVEERDEK